MQEEAEEEYKRLFPDHSSAFADFEAIPDGIEPMDLSEGAFDPGKEEVDSKAGQALLQGQLLSDLASLQSWYLP